MLAGCVLGALLVFGLGQAEAAIQVRMNGELLSVQADNAPLHDILQAVAKAGQFLLRLDAPLSDPVSVHFEQQPILEGLDLLLRDQSSLIQYTHEQGRVRVSEVTVLAPNSPPARVGTGTRVEAADAAESPAAAMQILRTFATSAEASPAERIGAALALADGGEAARARDVLVQLLGGQEGPSVRQEALVALTEFEGMALDSIGSAATHDPDPSVRSFALALLSEAAKTDGRAGATLEQAALQDPDAGIRQTALALLSEMAKTDRQVEATLEQAALQDPDAGIRQTARALLEATRPVNP